MSKKTYITGADAIVDGVMIPDAAILIEDGWIAAINPESAHDAKEIPMDKKIIMPGMIDLHCDALEKEVEPRPNVHFPLPFAVAQADKRNASAGISTVFHALSFANEELGVRNNAFAASIARSVHAWQAHALVDNRVHCRYEITDETALPVLLELLSHQDMHLLSFMDHTPGQGQFKDMAAYRQYISRTYKTSEQQLDNIIERKQLAAASAMDRVKQLVNAAHQHQVAVASHDDDNPERVDTMASLGVNISEFPINQETAHYARSKNIDTIFGAPNILRGKSQSGSMRAVDAVKAGVASCLCSDYSPATLLIAVFKLAEQTELTLAQAIQLVTLNPARAAGLNDRGEISVGKRADLAAISLFGELPQVASLWVHGKLAYFAGYDHG